MDEPGSLYVPVEEELPAVYRRDAESWEQIRTFFRPFNVLSRRFLLALEELPAWLSPAAPDVVPPGTWGDDPREQFERQNEVLDEIASWFDFAFEPAALWELPTDHGAAGAVLRDKARTLRALPRLMRSRATAPGFLELFCACFRLDPRAEGECPVLLEYGAYRPADGRPSAQAGDAKVDCSTDAGDPGELGDDGDERIVCDGDDPPIRDDGYAWRVSMLLPPVEYFGTWDGLRAVHGWIDREAPAHLWIDVHRVTGSFWTELVREVLPSGASRETILRLVRERVTDDEAVGVDDPDRPPAGAGQLNVGRLAGRDGGNQA